MTQDGWPNDPSPEQIRREWSATVSALPVGTRITGQVVACRAFGVFIRIDDVPNALGLADIGSMPPGACLPGLGAQVSGEVVWHTDHNYEVRIRLSEWIDHG